MLSGDTPNIQYVDADLADYDLGSSRYDYISCIASIHHMPFAETITRLHQALSPGGVLAILGCYRQSTPADYLPDLIAIPANMVANVAIGAKARHGRRPAGQRNTAPVMDPQMSLPEIKSEASRLLAGALIRRRLYWRYSLTYQRPSSPAR